MPTTPYNEEKTEQLHSGLKEASLETGSSLIPVVIGKSFLLFNYLTSPKGMNHFIC